MLAKLTYRFLRHRHYWRTVNFDELSELYISSALRSLAMSVVGVFVPVYLYKLGIDLQVILAFFALVFLSRIFFDILAGFIIARVGPKHTIAISNLIQIVFLTLLLSLSELGWPLPLLALILGLSNSLYFCAYHTDFSKVKHSKHGGKELGFMFTFERIGAVAGPLLGGIVATVFDPRYTIAVGIIFYVISLVPIFLSPEPVRTRQSITYFGLPFGKRWRDYVCYAGFNFENTSCMIAWPLLISITVFTTATFAKLGAITALSTAVTLFVAHLIGATIDKKHGLKLLRISVILNTLVHFGRPFMLTNPGVVATNVINDPLTVGYRMPLIKSIYDVADTLPGYRIAYVCSVESYGSFGKALFWMLLFAFSMFWQPIEVMKWFFVFVGLVSLIMLVERFEALRS